MRCGVKTGVDKNGKDIIRYGLMLFPDGYTWPEGVPVPYVSNSSVTTLAVSYKYITNDDAPKYTIPEFAVFEKGGVVFLPCAGQRTAASQESPYAMEFCTCETLSGVSSFNNEGHYWTSFSAQANVTRSANACLTESLTTGTNAKSVRLVNDIE